MIGTLIINSPNHTNLSTNNATGIDDRPAIPLLNNPNNRDLPGWRTRLTGENVTSPMAITTVAKIRRTYATISTGAGYRIALMSVKRD